MTVVARLRKLLADTQPFPMPFNAYQLKQQNADLRQGVDEAAAELERLRAPIDDEGVRDKIEILRARDLGIAEFHAMQIPVAELLARLWHSAQQAKQDREDAERYRWLRTNPTWVGFEHDFEPDKFDRALDADIVARQSSAGREDG